VICIVIIFLLLGALLFLYIELKKESKSSSEHDSLLQAIKEENMIIQSRNNQLSLLIIKQSRENSILKENIRELQARPKTVNKQFTRDDLLKIRYYVHPDKTNSKSSDLFIKVNKLLENK